MHAISQPGEATDVPRGIVRDVTPLSLWGGESLIYKSIIALSALALPVIAASNWFLRGTPSWPQLAVAGSILVVALLCHRIAQSGRRDVAAALLVGTIWSTVTIYAFNSGYGMHSAVVFVYLPCVLYTALFFGLIIASAELALTVGALVLMFVAEERGHLGGAAAIVAQGTNFNFLIGVIVSCVGTLAVGAVYHRRIEREAARLVAEAEQRRQAMERAQVAQARLEATHAELQKLHAQLAERARSRDVEMARVKRDIDLFQDVMSKDIPASLRALREALASPDEDIESRLQREIARMESVAGALEELGRHRQPALQRSPVHLTALAQDEVRHLRATREFARVRFDVDAGLHAESDRPMLTALMRHLIKRAARACQTEPEPRVHVGSGSRDGRAVFFVRDNGPGMDAAGRGKLFRPFERDSAIDDTVDIGIVSARRIVERHGGEFVVESLPGQGSTIFFSLPAA